MGRGYLLWDPLRPEAAQTQLESCHPKTPPPPPHPPPGVPDAAKRARCPHIWFVLKGELKFFALSGLGVKGYVGLEVSGCTLRLCWLQVGSLAGAVMELAAGAEK